MIDFIVVSQASSSNAGKNPAQRLTRLQQKKKATEAKSDGDPLARGTHFSYSLWELVGACAWVKVGSGR